MPTPFLPSETAENVAPYRDRHAHGCAPCDTRPRELEENLFRGLSPQVGWQRVFGGQVIARRWSPPSARSTGTLRSLACTPISCVRATLPFPIIYEVDRIRDGSSFGDAPAWWRSSTARPSSPCPPLPRRRGWIRAPVRHAGGADAGDAAGRQELKDEVSRSRAPEAIRRYWSARGRSRSGPSRSTLFLAREGVPKQDVWVESGRGRCLTSVISSAGPRLSFPTMNAPRHVALRTRQSVFDRSLQVPASTHAMWFQPALENGRLLLYTPGQSQRARCPGMTRGSLFERSGVLIALCRPGRIDPQKGNCVNFLPFLDLLIF